MGLPSIKITVQREGKWTEIDSYDLLPGGHFYSQYTHITKEISVHLEDQLEEEKS